MTVIAISEFEEEVNRLYERITDTPWSELDQVIRMYVQTLVAIRDDRPDAQEVKAAFFESAMAAPVALLSYKGIRVVGEAMSPLEDVYGIWFVLSRPPGVNSEAQSYGLVKAWHPLDLSAEHLFRQVVLDRKPAEKITYGLKVGRGLSDSYVSGLPVFEGMDSGSRLPIIEPDYFHKNPMIGVDTVTFPVASRLNKVYYLSDFKMVSYIEVRLNPALTISR